VFTTSVVFQVHFDVNGFHVADGDPLPRRSLAAGDFGGQALQVTLVTSIVFMGQLVGFLIPSPGTLVPGFAIGGFAETIQDLVEGDSYGVDRKGLRPLHLVDC